MCTYHSEPCVNVNNLHFTSISSTRTKKKYTHMADRKNAIFAAWELGKPVWAEYDTAVLRLVANYQYAATSAAGDELPS